MNNAQDILSDHFFDYTPIIAHLREQRSDIVTIGEKTNENGYSIPLTVMTFKKNEDRRFVHIDIKSNGVWKHVVLLLNPNGPGIPFLASTGIDDILNKELQANNDAVAALQAVLDGKISELNPVVNNIEYATGEDIWHVGFWWRANDEIRALQIAWNFPSQEEADENVKTILSFLKIGL